MEISLELEGMTGLAKLALIILLPFILGVIAGRKFK